MNDLLQGSSPETYRRVSHLILLALSFVTTRLSIKRIKTSPHSQKNIRCYTNTLKSIKISYFREKC